MNAYQVKTPNNGTQYVRTIEAVIDVLHQDGWDWECIPIHCFENNGVSRVIRAGGLRDELTRNAKSPIHHIAQCETIDIHKWSDSEAIIEAMNNAYITISRITID